MFSTLTLQVVRSSRETSRKNINQNHFLFFFIAVLDGAVLLRGLLIAYAIFTVRHVLRGENHAFQKEVTIYHYCIIEQMNSMVGGTKFKQHVICAFFCLKGVEN